MGRRRQVVEADETYIGRKKVRRCARGTTKTWCSLWSSAAAKCAPSILSGNEFDPIKGSHQEPGIARRNPPHDRRSPMYGSSASSSPTINGQSLSTPIRPRRGAHEHIEGFFSVFKRGMKGVYQHCGERICTATLPSSISAITTASAMGIEDAERASLALRASAASASPIVVLTKRKEVAAEQAVEAVKDAIRDILYQRFLDGKD